MTIRETILQDMVARLNAPERPSGVPETQRSYGAAVGILPHIALYPEKEDAEVWQGIRGAPSLTKRTLVVSIECRAQGDATDRPDTAVEPLLSWIVKALSGVVSEGNTGPYHLMFEESTEWDFDQTEHAYVLARLRVGVQYQTKVNDPDSWA